MPSTSKRPTTKAMPFENAPDNQSSVDVDPDTVPSVEPRMVPRSNRSSTFWRGFLLSIAVLIIVVGLGWVAINKGFIAKKQGSQYAVFLSTGQALFGTLGRMTSDTIELKNVYYIQLIDQQVPGVEGQEPQVYKQPQLIRKAEDLYGPTGTVMINREQMLYMEPLRADSEVVKQMSAQP